MGSAAKDESPNPKILCSSPVQIQVESPTRATDYCAAGARSSIGVVWTEPRQFMDNLQQGDIMTEELNPPAQHPEGSPQDNSEEERVHLALERARQRVKPIVKLELEGEITTNDLLNLILMR